MGCHFLLQGIFLTQVSDHMSSALQADTLPSEPPGKPPGTPLRDPYFSPRRRHGVLSGGTTTWLLSGSWPCSSQAQPPFQMRVRVPGSHRGICRPSCRLGTLMASLFGPSPHSRFLPSSRETKSVFYPRLSVPVKAGVARSPAGSPVPSHLCPALPSPGELSPKWAHSCSVRLGRVVFPSLRFIPTGPLAPAWSFCNLLFAFVALPTQQRKKGTCLSCLLFLCLCLTCCLDAQSCPVLLRPHGQ